jgi:hypothetical protein
MKFISISILFICLLSATFSKWILIAAYELNQQYISKELCINKTNPSAHCNGHCYLNKQLNNEEKPASPFNTNSSEKFDIQLFCVELPAGETASSALKKSFSNKPQYFTPQQYIQNLFQPPGV